MSAIALTPEAPSGDLAENPSPPAPGEHRPGQEPSRVAAAYVALLIALLLLSAGLSLLWSHAKLLSQDEIFVLGTDSVANLRTLLQVQLRTPISLDPLVYHWLGFVSLKALHPRTVAGQAFALRLPSLLGFLLMQACLFLFVSRSLVDSFQKDPARWRAATLAAVFPALTASFYYSAEARPYGLLLGLTGLIMVSWQAATQADKHREFTGRLLGSSRAVALVLLALSLALALNTHYFAVLLLLPLVAAELSRTLHRRHLDLPVTAAIVVGVAGVVFTLPFQHAAGEFRQHYYNLGSLSPHTITQAYRALLVDYTEATLALQQTCAAMLVLCAAALAYFVFRQGRSASSWRFRTDLIFLLTLSALPLVGYALARFVTHSFEARYVLGALPGLTALLACALAPLLRRRAVFLATLALLTSCVLATGASHVRAEHERATAILATLQFPPRATTSPALGPAPLFIQDMGTFEMAHLYTPDPALRSRLTLLYSREQELRWDGHDTASLTALHLQQFSAVPVVSWNTLRNTPGPHLLLLHYSGWNWTSQALAASDATVIPLGPGFGGDAVRVSWEEPPASHPERR